MSCCPSVKCRNTGSGYVKPPSGSAESSKKLDELMAARALQDHTFFPPLHAAPAPAPAMQQPNVCSTGTCPIPTDVKKSK